MSQHPTPGMGVVTLVDTKTSQGNHEGADYDLISLVRDTSSTIQLAGFIARHAGTRLEIPGLREVGEQLGDLKERINSEIAAYFARAKKSGDPHDKQFVAELRKDRRDAETALTHLDGLSWERNEENDTLVGAVLFNLREGIRGLTSAIERSARSLGSDGR